MHHDTHCLNFTKDRAILWELAAGQRANQMIWSDDRLFRMQAKIMFCYDGKITSKLLSLDEDKQAAASIP